ncbi:hypothetical protein NKJ26_16905 [Mesorhizobium sp. M0152]|uniref:hypothetical protein n=1 Tax=unclassified Mesorhizobium TaxID=325217 RepID=UPI003334EE1F
MPKDHLSRLVVALVREELDLSAMAGSYRSALGQPPFDPRMMTALLLHGYANGVYYHGGSPERQWSGRTS